LLEYLPKRYLFSEIDMKVRLRVDISINSIKGGSPVPPEATLPMLVWANISVRGSLDPDLVLTPERRPKTLVDPLSSSSSRLRFP
jgi:hypothetical protein